MNKLNNFKSSERIVGGIGVDIDKYPFYVRLNINGGGLCGGSIIGEEWVLTAAHCLMQVSPSELKIYAGLDEYKDDESYKFDVKSIITHPDYNNRSLDNDIALVRVKITDSRTLLNFGKKINLPSSNISLEQGLGCYACGFGTTSSGGNISYDLLAVDLKITDQGGYDTVNDLLTNNMIYANNDSKDSCQGDSGGPLVINCTELLNCSNEEVTQIGIVSWGYGCADPNYPGVYTKLQNYINWIEEKQKLFNCEAGDVYISDSLKEFIENDKNITIEKNCFDLDTLEEYTKLDISNKFYNNIEGLNNFTNLIEFNCFNNDISYLNLSTLVNLEILNCSSNFLYELDVSELSKLKNLKCDNNFISEIKLRNDDQYEELILYNNPITINDFSIYKKLRILDIDYTSITNVDLTENINIEELWIGGLRLQNKVNINNLTKLKLFGYYEINKNLQFPSLENNLNLEKLFISNIKIYELDLTFLDKLKVVWAYDNNLNCIKVNQDQYNNYRQSELWDTDDNIFGSGRYLWETNNKFSRDNKNLYLDCNLYCENGLVNLGCGCGNEEPDILGSCNDLFIKLFFGVLIIGCLFILYKLIFRKKKSKNKSRSSDINNLEVLYNRLNSISRKLKQLKY